MNTALKPFLWLGLLAAMVLATTAQAEEPGAMVQDTTEKVLERLRADREDLQQNPDKIYPLVQELVLPKFDFTRMSALVLGKYWRKASREQKIEFTREFRTLLVRTYAKALLEYTEQTIKYLPVHRGEGSKKVTVKTVIEQGGGHTDIPLNYTLYQTRKGWRVIDVIIEGISLLSNYRTSFGTEIRRDGLDKLIANLKENNAKVGADAGSGESGTDDSGAGDV